MSGPTEEQSANSSRFGPVVFLDSIKVADVTACDTAEGWLVKCKRNPAGDLAIVRDCIQTETLYGIVTIKGQDHG